MKALAKYDDWRWGTVLGQAKMTSRAGDEDADVAVDLQASH